jgi:hypothetical protein
MDTFAGGEEGADGVGDREAVKRKAANTRAFLDRHLADLIAEREEQARLAAMLR